MDRIKLLGNGVLLSILILFLFQVLIANRAVVELEVTTDIRTLFKIYHKSEDGNWAEKNVATQLIVPGKSSYSFSLTDIQDVSQLRIDTSESMATVTVHSLKIEQVGYLPLYINSPEQFEKLRQGPGIESFTFAKDGFTVIPSTKDPNLFFDVPKLVEKNNSLLWFVWVVLLVGLAALLIFHSESLFYRASFVPYCGTMVFALIFVMAGVSSFNTHPDEIVHVAAAKYYMENSIPPVVGDEGIRDTYSIYGVSRLHGGEVAYFIAGKFAKIIEPLQLQPYQSLRYFNVFLFAILLFATLKSVSFRILFIPLLLSPQIWYIFSYFNSEGFALFVLMSCVYQLAVEESAWNRMLSGGVLRWGDFLKRPAVGILLGLLFLLKKNFYFFIVYIFFYLLWRLVFKKTVFSGALVYRVVAILLLGGIVFGSVRGIDAYVNDFKKDDKILEARENYATELYKPSTPLEEKFVYLQLRDRGVTFSEVAKDMQWGEKSFRTTFGEYGYTSVAASFNYYDFVRCAALALFLVVICCTALRGGLKGNSLLAAMIFCGTTLMAMAFYHAWTVDFQAQGRYFLPIVGMVSIFFYHNKKNLSNVVCGFPAAILYLAALYSFVFVGLAGIGKAAFSIG